MNLYFSVSLISNFNFFNDDDNNNKKYAHRIGSRRPSLASVHSTSSSIKSYGAARFEKELQQKEIRQEMKLRLTRLQQQQQLIQNKPHIIITDPHVISGAIPKTIALKTPSPLTPNSLDELLPCVLETAEVNHTFFIDSFFINLRSYFYYLKFYFSHRRQSNYTVPKHIPVYVNQHLVTSYLIKKKNEKKKLYVKLSRNLFV